MIDPIKILSKQQEALVVQHHREDHPAVCQGCYEKSMKCLTRTAVVPKLACSVAAGRGS